MYTLQVATRNAGAAVEVAAILDIGGSFCTYSWIFLLTVKLLCLQSLKALIRHTQTHSPTVSKKLQL